MILTGPEADGSCIDVVRVREKGNTLFERCGIAAGIKIISNSSLVTLDLIASTKLYPARGFLLQYQGRSMTLISSISTEILNEHSRFILTLNRRKFIYVDAL